MPGSTTTTPQQSRLPPQRHDFKTAAAKRCYDWRLKQKQKKARAAARAAAACPEESDQRQVPEEPEESEEWYLSDDLSDSGEACCCTHVGAKLEPPRHGTVRGHFVISG